MCTVQALGTAPRYGVPVTYVVNNSYYAILTSFAGLTDAGKGVPDLDLPDLDNASIARVFGVPAETVDDPSVFEQKLGNPIAGDGPYPLIVVVDPAALTLFG